MPLHLLKGKKAQLQMGESIIVIILIIILAMFGLIFSASQAKEKYQIRIDTYESFNAVETAQIVTSLYELRCAKEGLESTCVDIYKVRALQKEMLANEEAYYYYNNLLRDAKITLQEIYPEERESITIYEVNASEGLQEKKFVVIPVSIHDPTTDRLSFGILTVERYSAGVNT